MPDSDVLWQKLRNAVRVYTNAMDAHITVTIRRQVEDLTKYITNTVKNLRPGASWTGLREQRLVDTKLYMQTNCNFMRLCKVFELYGSHRQSQRYVSVVAQLTTQ